MALTCNIDARGKVARFIYGIVLLIAGLLLAYLWAWASGSWWRWTIVGVCVLSGAFAIFEARAGWCVVRAMGIRTPM